MDLKCVNFNINENFQKHFLPNIFKVLVLSLIILVLFLLLYVPFSVKNYFDKKLYEIDIKQGSTANQIIDKLYDDGIIRDKISLKFYITILGVGDKFKAGTYNLSPSMTNAQIVSLLTKGISVNTMKKVLIPEGTSIYKMAKILVSAGIKINQKEFENLEVNGITGRLVEKFPFLKLVPIKSLEGYLFPDTYFFNENSSINEIVEMMLNRFSEKVLPIYYQSKTDLTLHQVITLASIVEKEARIEKERPIIASVFLNRLKLGIALRADPTVKYVLEKPTKRVKFSDLKVNSPYNTYLYKGLPPGPICNPGIASIKAVLNPAKTNYLYFVSNGDGTHTFSSSWIEHKKAADRFRSTRN